MKKVALIVALSLVLMVVGAGVASANSVDPVGVQSYPLYAGQDMLVGEVLVGSEVGHVCVKFVLNGDAITEGWVITEAHVDVADSPDGIPQKNGNPIPGKFFINEAVPGLTEAGWYCVPVAAEWEAPYVVAAHAVVERTECETLEEAPYGAFAVTTYSQGLLKNGGPVRPGRSDPTAVLTWDTNRVETDFFSLGFGGSIVLEFDCCIANGDGPDVLVVEDTWGSYPAETADVYASQDNVNWVFLGEADNLTRDTTYNWQTVSEFDLGELECAKYIKVVDTTNPDDFVTRPEADGYDLNTVQALNDCLECTVFNETAWGGTLGFSGKNWATYIEYDCGYYTLDIETVNNNSNYTHWYEITYCPVAGTLAGIGGYDGAGGPWTETISDIAFDGTTLSFKAVYDPPAPNAGYTWYPSFDLIGDGTLLFNDGYGSDNVYAATGTWDLLH